MGSPHILHVVGARPNFMKVAPVMRALEGLTQQTLVHTGQHYDIDMSETLFRDLGLRPPDVNLDVGSKTHGVQTGEIMVKLEPLMDQQQPDICVVYGDCQFDDGRCCHSADSLLRAPEQYELMSGRAHFGKGLTRPPRR